ncbi:hypothetical protein R5W24_005330 [Gemmata sp. JC717]|uniref:hypothetical protein n=1 Tax=Gemmata algarum TaxID=2975278 RepID=UPI0021BB567C|nr:hypothetical protein [Gemmata algarum]MDY3556167.1 hypothetical protein [Gemmata algarum]
MSNDEWKTCTDTYQLLCTLRSVPHPKLYVVVREITRNYWTEEADQYWKERLCCYDYTSFLYHGACETRDSILNGAEHADFILDLVVMSNPDQQSFPDNELELSSYLPAGQDRLIKEIIGPLTPINFNSEWRTSDVVALAEGGRAQAAFDRMPILADALQDAGCDNGDILNHCRHEQQHNEHCWVLRGILEGDGRATPVGTETGRGAPR